MARVRSILTATVLAAWPAGGCTSLGPTPAEYAARPPAAVPVDPAARERVAQATAAALLALRAGDPTAAQGRAEVALALDPRAARARAVRGRAILDAAREADPVPLAVLEQAEGELRLAVELGPDDPEIRHLYAGFLEVDGHVTRAVEELEALLKLAPDHIDGLRACGRLHFELGHERQALVRLRALLERVPEDAEALFRVAQCELRLAQGIRQGDPDGGAGPEAGARDGYLRAADAFRRCVERRPADVAGYLGEAAARFGAAELLAARDVPRANEELARVEVLLTRATTVDTSTPGPHHSLGWLHEHRGDVPRARAAYEAALRIDKDYLPSILNIARLLDTAGETSAARDFCRRALRLQVSDAERRRLQEYLDGAKTP